jgi:aryl-alcohol dehydrogenase-like predicted oxidoreductase
MEKRKLGYSGIEIHPMIFGGNVFGWTVDERSSFHLLDAFTDAGFECIDTADVYSKWAPGNTGGESENIIGKWMKHKGNRDKVIIATKVGAEMGPGKKGLSRKYILEAVESSLIRLHTDYIDLYQTHYDDFSVPLEETLEAYSHLVQQGKVRTIGASNISGERLLASMQCSKDHGFPAYEALQPLYNLYDREKFEKEYEQIVNQKGLSAIPYYSLASGFLTGKYRSEEDLTKSVRGEGIRKYLNERGDRIINTLEVIAEKHHTTSSVIALAWLIHHPSITAPIASATSLAQVKSMTDAAALQLDENDFAVLVQESSWKEEEMQEENT